jgi:hypothetical protein
MPKMWGRVYQTAFSDYKQSLQFRRLNEEKGDIQLAVSIHIQIVRGIVLKCSDCSVFWIPSCTPFYFDCFLLQMIVILYHSDIRSSWVFGSVFGSLDLGYWMW